MPKEAVIMRPHSVLKYRASLDFIWLHSTSKGFIGHGWASFGFIRPQWASLSDSSDFIGLHLASLDLKGSY